MNDTILKFGYPGTLIREYTHWVLLLRPAQATLGSMVLAHKSDAQSAGDLDAESYAELARIKAEVESTLRELFGMEKINYLMLMMVDREVHYHVIPRYSQEKKFGAQSFTDPGWPAVPALGPTNEVSPEVFTALGLALRDGWITKGETSG
ncbi:MAG: diadenosine tetraphosphate (Ap4A) HIT family hydrolase [Planctomycetota bacterium]|jgi:diadenosine tetraphosphate (Ap4A) HIT family hydrolase